MKQGFTLIELLVYMAIMSFVIVVAGRVFSDATGMRVRSQNMLASSEEIGNLSAIIKEDISQMGAKVLGVSSASNYKFEVREKVYISTTGTGDSSSYMLWHSPRGDVKKDSLDSLIFRKIDYDGNGKFLGVRQIAWYANDDGEIYRKCQTIDGSDEDGGNCPVENPSEVLMATGVNKFYLNPSVPGIEAASSSTSASSSSNSAFSFIERPAGGNVKNFSVEEINASTVDMSGFAYNPIVSASSSASSSLNFNQALLAKYGEKINCEKYNLKKGETYAVEFYMPPIPNTGNNSNKDFINSTQFLPGIDHISVGIRNASDYSVPNNAPIDVLIYPTQIEDSFLRYAEFSPEEDMPNVCIALTFSFFSPNARKGKLRFMDFKVYGKDDTSFHFPKYGDSDYDAKYGTEDYAGADKIRRKENVKAFEMFLEVERKQEISRTSGDANGMIILTPNNGIKASGSDP